MKEIKIHFLAYAVGIFLLAIFELVGLMNPVRSISEKMLVPVMMLSSRMLQIAKLPFDVTIKNFQGYQHVQDLELRYAEDEAKLGEMEKLKSENEELRKMIEQNTAQKNKKLSIVSPIVAYSQPFLGKGKNDGVAEGNMVLVANTLIGRIGKVSDSQSEVILLSEKTGLPILSKTEFGVTGLVVGDGKQVILSEIPADKEIKVGDRVVTVGQAGVDEGIFIGKVRSLGKKAGSSTQIAVLDQIISFYDNHLVEVRSE